MPLDIWDDIWLVESTAVDCGLLELPIEDVTNVADPELLPDEVAPFEYCADDDPLPCPFVEDSCGLKLATETLCEDPKLATDVARLELWPCEVDVANPELVRDALLPESGDCEA